MKHEMKFKNILAEDCALFQIQTTLLHRKTAFEFFNRFDDVYFLIFIQANIYLRFFYIKKKTNNRIQEPPLQIQEHLRVSASCTNSGRDSESEHTAGKGALQCQTTSHEPLR